MNIFKKCKNYSIFLFNLKFCEALEVSVFTYFLCFILTKRKYRKW